MITFLWLMVILNISLLVAGFLLIRRLKSQLASLDAEAKGLAKEVEPATEALMFELKKQAPMLISIEILNPLQLAANENSLAGTLGSLSPNLIRKVVYDRAADIMRTQLVEKGVDADLRVIKRDKSRTEALTTAGSDGQKGVGE